MGSAVYQEDPGGLKAIKNKDGKWGDILMTAMFLGMISAFLGMVFSDIRSGLKGWILIFVLLFSALLMGICGILIKKCNMKWLENYALPISMLGAMVVLVVGDHTDDRIGGEDNEEKKL